MLPPVPDVAAWRILRRDAATQRPAFEAIATRHGLAASELSPLDKGTHFVWATRRNVIKLFVPLWTEDASVETTLLEMVTGTVLPVPQLEAQGELAIGDPLQLIPDAARRHAVDLIVLSHRRRGRLARWGSDSPGQSLLDLVSCSILVATGAERRD